MASRTLELSSSFPSSYIHNFTKRKKWELKPSYIFPKTLKYYLVTLLTKKFYCVFVVSKLNVGFVIHCFLHYEKGVFCNWPCNSIFELHWTFATHRIYGTIHYNFVTTIPFQLLCNSPMTTIIMSCWRHFSSIHQNLTHGTMKIFCDFFEILISIVHYDYSF
jgi:hypothetical protein